MGSWRRIAFSAVALIATAFALVSCNANSLIYHPHAEEAAPTLPGVEAVRIATQDGESLVAWHRAPQSGQPIFLFFDGNAGRPELWSERWAQIAAQGAGFLAVYYRGYSGSTGRPNERGLHLDASAGYAWLIEHNYEPRDIVIHGFSLGSGVAVRLASERPARALVLEAPFTGVDDVAAAHYSPLARVIVRDRFPTRDWIGEVRMPVLIVHGDADRVVPFAQGQRLYELANQPKQFIRMRGSDHASLVRDGMYPRIAAFLEQHSGE